MRRKVTASAGAALGVGVVFVPAAEAETFTVSIPASCENVVEAG
jgi:hypothetical protein